MKILNKIDNIVIEVSDKNRINKLLGYPDRFEIFEEETKVVEPEKNEFEEETPKKSKKYNK